MSEFTEVIEITGEDTASDILRGVMGNITSMQDKVMGLVGSLTALAGTIGASLSFAAFISSGIEMNKTLEDTRTGIAGVILMNQTYTDETGRVVGAQESLQAALKTSSEIQQKLKVDALSTAASYQELVQTFQGAVGPAMAAGVKDLDKVREITVSAAKTMQALGIDSHQASQEIRAMFTGEQGPDNRLNTVLGITKGEIEKVRKSGGDLAQFYLDKMAPAVRAADEASQNFSVRLSNLGDTFGQLAGDVTKPIFDALKNQIVTVGNSAEGFRGQLSEMGTRAGEIVTAFAPLITSLVAVALAVADAGLKFLGAMSPLVPVIQSVVDVVVFLVDKLGPLGIGIYASVTAFGAISTAVAAIPGLFGSAATAAGAFNAVLLANPYVAAAAAITGLTVAIGGYLAVSSAEREADDAWAGSVATLNTYIETIKKKTGAELDGVQAEKLMKLSLVEKKEVLDILKSAYKGQIVSMEDLDEIIKVTTTHLKANAKETGISPQAEKALEATKKKYDELLTKAKEHLAFLQSPLNMSVFEKIKEKYGHDIDAWTKKYGESSELVKTATQEMELELLRKAQSIADAYKAVPAAVDVSGAAAAGSVQKFSKTTQEITVGTSNVAREAWIGAFNAIVEHIPTVEAGMVAALTSVWDSLAHSFDDAFFDVMTGRLDQLGDVFKSFGQSILKTLSSYFSQIAQKWVSTQLEMGSGGGLGLGQNIGGSGWGGAAVNVGAGLGIGSAVGSVSGAPGFGTGATVGGAAGAVLGTYVFPGIGTAIGAIIGAIIGGIIGIFAAAKTEMHIMISQADITGINGVPGNAVGGILTAFRENLVGGLSDAFRTSGVGSASDLTQAVNERIIEYYKAMKFDVHAGSDEDLQKDLSRLLTDQIPKELLHQMIGGTVIGGQDLPGISGGSKYGFMVDPTAPIQAMLKGLGFSLDKIHELSNRIDTSDPQKWLQMISGLVGVVVGFRDLSKDFAKSTAEIFGDITAARQKTAAQSFAESATQIKDLAKDLSLYSGDEQIRRAQQLIQLGTQRYQAELQYLAQIQQLQENITASITGQQRDIRYGMLGNDTAAQKSFLSAELANLQQQLSAATAPEVVQQLVQQIQQRSGQLFGLFGADDPGRIDAGNNIIKMLDWVNSVAQQKLKEAADAVTATNAGLSEVLQNATKLFTQLGGALDTLPSTVGGASGGLEEIDRGARRTGRSLAALADAIDAATSRLGGTPPAAEAAAPTSTGRSTSTGDTASFLRSNYGRFIPRTA